jgi:uncharacterized MAPEG superfamily protein
MSFADWMILAAVFLPYVTVAAGKWTKKNFDNSHPRDWEQGLQGWQARAIAAHHNHFEAFAPFAAGVIVAQLAQVAQNRVDLLAGLFVLARVIYTLCYLTNRASLRSIVWSLGFLCVILLFLSAV